MKSPSKIRQSWRIIEPKPLRPNGESTLEVGMFDKK